MNNSGTVTPGIAAPSMVKPKAGLSPSSAGSTILFDIKAIDDAIKQRGVSLIHMTAMPCPVGRLLRDDSTRRPHDDHEGCQGGFIYTPIGTVTCLFTSNTNRKNFLDQGIAEVDHVACTFSRMYDDTGLEVKVMPFDRLYLAEPNITVVQWELAQFSGSGFDAFKFPVVQVQALIDWRGQSYRQGIDFTVENGKIHWGSNSPGINPDTGVGALYSLRYTYRPYYIVDVLGHEIRVINTFDTSTGSKTTIPGWFQANLVRENVKRNADNDPLSRAPASRQQLSDNQVDFANDVFVPTEST